MSERISFLNFTADGGRKNWAPSPWDNMGRPKENPDAEPDPEDDTEGPAEPAPGGNYDGDPPELDFEFVIKLLDGVPLSVWMATIALAVVAFGASRTSNA